MALNSIYPHLLQWIIEIKKRNMDIILDNVVQSNWDQTYTVFMDNLHLWYHVCSSNKNINSSCKSSLIRTVNSTLNARVNMHANTVGNLARVGVRGRCRIAPPRFLADCRKRRLDHGSFVSAVYLVIYFLWFVLCLCVYFCDLYSVFSLLSVSNSRVTYTVSGEALNSTESNPILT